MSRRCSDELDLSGGIELSARGAQAEHRTDGTSRLAGQAHGRAQFHHGLVEIAGTPAAEQRLGGCQRPRLPDQFRTRAPARAQHFRPPPPRARRRRCWRWPPPCSGRCRAEHAAPQSSPGNFPPCCFDDDFRGGVHHAGAPVVSQAAPCRQHRRLPAPRPVSAPWESARRKRR